MGRERIDLTQEDIPRKWYNILPDLPESIPPYKDAENGKDVRNLPETYSKTASDLEFSEKRWIRIPDLVISSYIHCGRPRPLIRAKGLERFLKTPARIYYKCEDLPPCGTFKTNTALPQAYWAMKEGCGRTVFSGGSGRTTFTQASAAKKFGLTPTIFVAREDCQRNMDHVLFLRNMFEADVVESPSTRTEIGRRLLNEKPDHPGSFEIRREEVSEEARRSDDAVAILESFLNHVLMTQTITGLEVEKQLESIDEKPNIMIAPVGGGSNFYGLIAPFMRDYLNKKLQDVKFLAVESETSCKLTKGIYDYVCLNTLQGPMPGLLLKTYKIDKKTPLPPITAGGIWTQSTAPLIGFLRHSGFINTVVYPKDEMAIFEAARIFLNTEGLLLAPESSYAIRAAIDEAYKAKKIGVKKVIVVSISATTYLDFRAREGLYLSFMGRSSREKI